MKNEEKEQWVIQYEGNDIGLLSDGQNIEMFWESYLVIPKSPEDEKILRNKKLWEDCEFTFFHFQSQKQANAFCGGDYINYCLGEQDRIAMRGLYK